MLAHDLEGTGAGLIHHVGPYVLLGVVLLGLLVAGYRLVVTTRCAACQGVVRRAATVCVRCGAPLR